MNKPTSRFYVKYSIEGMGDHTAGPYGGLEEANSQLDDIAGYEGVCAAKIVPASQVETRFDYID